MSTDGIQQQYIPASLDGLVYVDVDGLTVNGVPVDLDNLVPYTNATKNLNLGTFNFETLGAVSAKQHVFPPFASTLMTGAMTSSIFTADAWGFANTISTVSLSPTVTASYLTLNNITNNSTIVTFQSDGIANFESTIVRTNHMAVGNFDVINLSTLTSAVAFIQNVNALNYVPYTGATDNLNMGASTITTTGLIHAGALRITSSVVNADYTLSVNSSDQLEFTNLSNGSIFKTNGADLFVTGNVNCATLGATNVEAGSNIYLAKGSTAEWRTALGMSDEYEILDNAGVMRLRLSKTTGLTVSTMNITQVPSATPSLALGLNGGGSVVSFAVPSATNILPLNNTFTGTNTFENTVSTLATTTVSSKAYLTQSLRTAGISSQAVNPGVITGGAPYLLTPSPASSPLASCYSPTQTWITGARYIFRFTGFTPSAFGISLIMYQANVGNTGAVAISASFPVVSGDFTGLFTPNVNSSFLGQVYLQWTGTANKTFSWTSFTYEVGTLEVDGLLEMTGIANINGGTTGSFAVQNNHMSSGSLTIGDTTRDYGGGTGGWNTNTAGLMMECLNNSEIAVHDAGTRVASMMYYTGADNTITLGRDMGFSGVPSAVATAGNLTVNGNITKTGTTAGNDIRIEGGTTTNSGYVNFVSGGTSRGYIGNASAVDVDVVAQNGAKLNFYTAGSKRLEIDTAGNVYAFGRIVKANDVNPTTTYISMIEGGGNTPYLSWFLNGTRKGYIGYASATNLDFAVENGAALSIYTSGSTRLQIASGGLTTINAGLNVAGGAIECANQPFCIVGGVSGASVFYPVGSVFGAGSLLFAYTSAGMSNSGTSGWSAGAGAFFFTKTGRWQVNWSFYWNNFAGGSRAVLLHYNSAGSLLETRYCALTGAGIGSDTTQAYSSLIYGAVGDFLQCQFQSGSGTLFFGGITHTHATFHFVA